MRSFNSRAPLTFCSASRNAAAVMPNGPISLYSTISADAGPAAAAHDRKLNAGAAPHRPVDLDPLRRHLYLDDASGSRRNDHVTVGQNAADSTPETSNAFHTGTVRSHDTATRQPARRYPISRVQ